MTSSTPNLDAAIAGAGPVVPFTPVFTLDDVRRDESRAQALIALIETPKETALKILDGVEMVAAVALPLAFPQAAPLIGVGLKAMDKIEEIIKRGGIEPTKDASDLLALYAEFNAAKAAVDAAKQEAGVDGPAEVPVVKDVSGSSARTNAMSATRAVDNGQLTMDREKHGEHGHDVKPGHKPGHGGGIHKDKHGNTVDAHGNILHHAPGNEPKKKSTGGTSSTSNSKKKK